MNFSTQWEEYWQGGQAIRWPWSDVVSYVTRYAPPTDRNYKVLELGFGSGANIAFFKGLGCQYYGIDGSEYAFEQVKRSHPDLSDRLVQGDFTRDCIFEQQFDLIFDRAALSHNTTAAIRQGLVLAHRKLKPRGKYIAIDWYSTAHPDYERGHPAEDTYTRTDFEAGVFAGVGRVHFSDKAHLLDLFSEFELTMLEHKLIQREIPDDGWKIATWNFVAQKC